MQTNKFWAWCDIWFYVEDVFIRGHYVSHKRDIPRNMTIRDMMNIRDSVVVMLFPGYQ